MEEFFTVDRARSLTPGAVLNLRTFRDINPAEFQAHVDALFPSGVSRHGDWYFLTQPKQPNAVNEVIELLAEYIRRAHYSSRPSRFQSWFGTATIADARAFRSEFGCGNGTIWRVKAGGCFRANMRLLTFGGSNLTRSWLVHQYWQGLAGNGAPFWECVLTPPIEVVDLVDMSGA